MQHAGQRSIVTVLLAGTNETDTNILPGCLASFIPAPLMLYYSCFACSIQEQRSSVGVLLAGTSRSGKTTLAGFSAAGLLVADVC